MRNVIEVSRGGAFDGQRASGSRFIRPARDQHASVSWASCVLESPPDHWFCVGLTLAYSNLNPQLDGLPERLSGPLPTRGPQTGPSTPDSPEDQPPVAYPPAPPRALGARLSPADQADLIAAFNAGATQKTLAAKYRISVRSVKRLVHGSSNRSQATANRLTPDQRDAIAHIYATTGATQAKLARTYGVDTSTIKRLLREARSTEPGAPFD
ncbi:helix-turn-helix domain-containing protein [Glycomyces terrestris]|nr:helix-turn-helix domain-containing protein [Glycomyces terrestris]